MDFQNMMGIQRMLAVAQATQESYRFPVTYPNFSQGADLSANENQLENAAIELFHQRMPDYRVQNLATELLVKRVLSEIEDQIDKEDVVLTNGCCTIKECPTTIFIECVLRSLGTLSQ